MHVIRLAQQDVFNASVLLQLCARNAIPTSSFNKAQLLVRAHVQLDIQRTQARGHANPPSSAILHVNQGHAL